MSQALLVSVRLHDRRWYGAGEWPPSPVRLFQALVAGVGHRGTLAEDHARALRWLEALPPPVIAAPAARAGHGFTNYVPNNDLDAVGGDPRRIGEIRAGKTIRPHLFEADPVLLYVWIFEPGDDAGVHAPVLGDVAERLYQFGCGVDMACACAELATSEEAEVRLTAHSGTIWRPAGEDALGGTRLRCPCPGTLQSLIDRHAAQGMRIRAGVFRKPPPPRFRMVGYNCPPERLLFDLKPIDPQRRFQPWPLTRAAELATVVRDAAAGRLCKELPGEAGKIERLLIGRGATEADKALRVRIVPLPSIGHAHVDPSIRRVLVERPPDCPIRSADLAWAFSGLDLAPVDGETGEVTPGTRPVLAFALDRTMLRHYGIEAERPARTWRTVTAIVLPTRRLSGRATGTARSATEAEAASAVRQALRLAGVRTAAETIRVQRGPLFGRGARAEAFAGGSRFPPARLWHVEIVFAEPVAGPLVIGDGRYCGLGLMEPVGDVLRDALILPIRKDSRPHVAHRATVVAALRRALMSLAADAEGHVPTLFSGHDDGPGPAASGRHRHVYLFADDSDGDGLLDRLGVVAPWRVDRSEAPRSGDRTSFEQAVGALGVLRAGRAGVLALKPACAPNGDDPLFTSARVWTSRTMYRPTRHARKGTDALVAAGADLAEECLRRGLPRPEIDVTRIDFGPRGGICASARLAFCVIVPGPIMLGHDAHCGGGQFAADEITDLSLRLCFQRLCTVIDSR